MSTFFIPTMVTFTPISVFPIRFFCFQSRKPYTTCRQRDRQTDRRTDGRARPVMWPIKTSALYRYKTTRSKSEAACRCCRRCWA